MKNCPKYEEMLFLDVYGELDSSSRSEWQSHLRACPLCREEYERMHRLVHRVKATMPPSFLSQAETDTLVRAVREDLDPMKSKKWSFGWQWLRRPWTLTPALATACVFAVFISLLSRGAFDTVFDKYMDPREEPWQKTVQAEDLEIIMNLDLLKQMDSLQKLVQSLDEPENDQQPNPETTPDTQGMIRHEQRSPNA